MKVGVIDIGTLKVKCLIAQISKSSQVKTLYQSNTLTCLGCRMAKNGNKPLAENLQQTVGELKRCKDLFDKEKVRKVRVVSTHALREMGKVGEEIAQALKEQLGLPVEIISQEEEANLFFQAVIKDFDIDEDFTLVDVGGGSVQILIGNKNELKNVYLLKTGASFLFDTFSPRHEPTDFPTRDEIRKMQEYILEQLASVPAKTKTPVIYGSSCIINLFKSLNMKMDKYPYSKKHPFKVQVPEMRRFLEDIIPVPYQEREKRYPFEQEYYMWGIDKAFLNILTICEKQQSPFVIPTNSNINEGLVLSLA